MRLMRREDVGAVAALERLSFSCPWSENMLAAELDNRYARYLVAYDDGVLVGYAGMYLVADECFICNLAVDPAWRRRGTARALLEKQIMWARENGAKRVMLEVRRSNTAAQILYAGFGFFVAGTRPNYYEHPREDALLMNLVFGESTQS